MARRKTSTSDQSLVLAAAHQAAHGGAAVYIPSGSVTCGTLYGLSEDGQTAFLRCEAGPLPSGLHDGPVSALCRTQWRGSGQGADQASPSRPASGSGGNGRSTSGGLSDMPLVQRATLILRPFGPPWEKSRSSTERQRRLYTATKKPLNTGRQFASDRWAACRFWKICTTRNLSHSDIRFAVPGHRRAHRGQRKPCLPAQPLAQPPGASGISAHARVMRRAAASIWSS